MVVEVHSAGESDFKALCEIYRKEYGKHVEDRVKSYLQYYHIKVLKENDKIIGALFWFVRESPHHGLAEIEDFFIDKGYRRKGLGTQLLKSAIEDVKKHFEALGCSARKIIVLTSKENPIARKCYEKQGFKFVAELGGLFKENVIEVMYMLSF